MPHTLGIQEVADGHWVGAVGNVWGLEDLLGVCLGLDTHVLLAETAITSVSAAHCAQMDALTPWPAVQCWHTSVDG